MGTSVQGFRDTLSRLQQAAESSGRSISNKQIASALKGLSGVALSEADQKRITSALKKAPLSAAALELAGDFFAAAASRSRRNDGDAFSRGPINKIRADDPTPSPTKPPVIVKVRADDPGPSRIPPVINKIRADDPTPSPTKPPVIVKVRADDPGPSRIPPVINKIRADDPTPSPTKPPVINKIRADDPAPSPTKPPVINKIRADEP